VSRLGTRARTGRDGPAHRAARLPGRVGPPAPRSWLDAESTWQLAARCAGADPELFFHPDGERGPAREARERAALRICAGCPVVEACLAHALRTPEASGVWGGLSEADLAARREQAGRMLVHDHAAAAPD
jgi:WhiB family redox-sensing transcriptional regulator